jgi:hypothetical protein
MTDLNLLKSYRGSSDPRSSSLLTDQIIISMITSLSTREVISGEAEDTNYPSNSHINSNLNCNNSNFSYNQ